MLWLDEDILAFPSILDAAEDENIIALGGNLDPQRLLLGYSLGLFPWYNEGETPILWQSPNPRFVLFPEQLTINRSLRRSVNRQKYTITFNQCFNEVLHRCAQIPRSEQEGTWLNPTLINSLTNLHIAGYAHSAEAWLNDQLVGGLYGITIGGVFYGESMFSEASDASKVAFVELVGRLERAGFKMIDCQDYTPHLERFGAIKLSRHHFYALLREYIKIKPNIWYQRSPLLDDH